MSFCCMFVTVKGRGFLYSLPSFGPRADPGVQAVSPQVIISYPPGGSCHCFPAGLRLPSQPHSITAPWPVPSYTAWWQRHIGVNNLPKVVMQLCPEQDFNPWPVDRKSNALPVVPPCHPCGVVVFFLCICLDTYFSAEDKASSVKFCTRFIGVQGRESHTLGNFAPQKPKIVQHVKDGECSSWWLHRVTCTQDRHVWIYGRPRRRTYLL